MDLTFWNLELKTPFFLVYYHYRAKTKQKIFKLISK
jgi:hypothetical protein